MSVEINWDRMHFKTIITTPVRSDGTFGPGISQWSSHGLLGSTVDDGQLPPRTILWMNGVVADLWTPNNSIYHALDAISSDYEKLATAVLEHNQNSLRDDVEETLAMPSSRVVLIDRASLEPEFRGQGGVGRLLISYILRHLVGDGDGIAVTLPHPFEVDSNDPEFEAELRKVRHVWQSIGFHPVNDDVWILDSASTTHSAAIERLEEKLGV
ncbi:hypothetical protein [Nocardia exalbida]|uniref:hypothetical protein n=1 Tax=Nocardia exalbida TaxID=290231 RepID=UPI000593B24C|nr:hypothetical protein [Nocardia exalbida]